MECGLAPAARTVRLRAKARGEDFFRARLPAVHKSLKDAH